MKKALIKRYLWYAGICFVLSIMMFIYANISFGLYPLLAGLCYIAIYFIVKQPIDLLKLSYLYHLLDLLPVIIIGLFALSPLGKAITYYDYNSLIYNRMHNELNGSYTVKYSSIYDEKGYEIMKWNINGPHVQEGILNVYNGDIEYTLQLNDVCMIKKYGRKYKVSKGKCVLD